MTTSCAASAAAASFHSPPASRRMRLACVYLATRSTVDPSPTDFCTSASHCDTSVGGTTMSVARDGRKPSGGSSMGRCSVERTRATISSVLPRPCQADQREGKTMEGKRGHHAQSVSVGWGGRSDGPLHKTGGQGPPGRAGSASKKEGGACSRVSERARVRTISSQRSPPCMTGGLARRISPSCGE